MKVLFLTKYGYLAPSSRYRAFQYVPYFRSRNSVVSVEPLLPDEYVRRLFNERRRSLGRVSRALLSRIAHLRSREYRSFDVVYVQNEMLPRCPFMLESRFYRDGPPVVVDYDDAIFHLYENRQLLREKIAAVMRAARCVIVGSRYLQSYAATFNRCVELVPTVINMSRYTAKCGYELENNTVIIGWIGTPTTARHLASHAPSFRALARKYKLTLRCVGAPQDFQMPGVQLEKIPWRLETETQWIRSFDIGVMPLPDDRFAKGKCGLKLIQYMGCGVPVVGSAVGANCEIIQDGTNGLLAVNQDEFVHKIEWLIRSVELRRRLGINGRQTVKLRYSLETQAPRFYRLLREAAAS